MVVLVDVIKAYALTRLFFLFIFQQIIFSCLLRIFFIVCGINAMKGEKLQILLDSNVRNDKFHFCTVMK